MICKKCNYKTKDDFNYCPSCGNACNNTDYIASSIFPSNKDREEMIEIIKELHNKM